MAKNILLTSLSAAESDLPLRYFSVRDDLKTEYCEAILSAEASTKYLLAKYDIDEIVVSGKKSTFDEGDDLRPLYLRDGNSFYSSEIQFLSTYSLYRYRIAQYIDEVTIDQQEYSELFSPEEQEKAIAFIEDFLKNTSTPDNLKRLNRLFDDLTSNSEYFEQFSKAYIEAFPEVKNDLKRHTKWLKNYLYSELRDSLKLGILPINTDVFVRFIPVTVMKSGQLVDNTMALRDVITEGDEHINLYVSLNSDDAADSFVIMNMLDILNAMPGSRVTVKKVFTVASAHMEPTGEIHDDTAGFGITELASASRTFLRYGKADMIVDFWEKSGERNERIASMIYAMRNIDVGLSMCNIAEVEYGINRLRALFKGGALWSESGYYGRLFNLIVDGIRADYGPLLDGTEIDFLDLVKWAYRHHFYQQTMTIIESRAPENIVNHGLFYYCNDRAKAEDVRRLLALQRLELRSHEYYVMDSIEHYFIKNYARGAARGGSRTGDPQEAYAQLRAESISNTDPERITGYTVCDNKETLKDMLYAYYHVGYLRNKINHAEADAMADERLIVPENDVSQAHHRLTESIEFFIQKYEKALEEGKGKKVRVVKIPASEVRSLAEKMKSEQAQAARS